MKINLYLILVLAVLFSPTLKAQCTDVTLSTQNDVDSFPSHHGCSIINGTLTITGDNIINLDSLSRITAIANSLIIVSNPELLNIDGLSHLTAVGSSGYGVISLVENFKLENIEGLASVTSVASDSTHVKVSIYIQSNFELTSIRGLRGLTVLPGALGIYGNNKLKNLDGLEGLTSVNSKVEIESNAELENIDGLRNLGTAKFGLFLTQNPALKNVNGLASLESIQNVGDDSHLSIRSNSALQDLDSLSSLTEIAGPKKTIDIAGNGNLLDGCGIFPILNNVVNCSGCESAINISGNRESVTKEIILANGVCRPSYPDHCVGDITLASQSEVDAFRVTRGCSVIEGSITITGSDITNLNGLSDITSIGNSLNIVDNPMLINIDGLRSLTIIKPADSGSTYLRISNNAMLTNVNGLASLVEMTGPGRELQIMNNPMLESGCGLFSLVSTNFSCGNNCEGAIQLTITGTTITWEEIMNGGGCDCKGSVTLSSQAAVDAFPVTYGCKVIGGTLTINGNDITNLDGLTSINNVHTALFVTSNPMLTNMSGLSNISHVGYNDLGEASVSIYNNDMLTTLEGMSGLRTLPGHLSIVGNNSLINLDGLDRLTELGNHASLRITDNDALVDIDALKSLTSVIQLYITENDALPNLNGLSSLTRVSGAGPDGFIEITNNRSLQNVDSLSALIYMDSPRKNLTVTGNTSLTRGCGLYPLLANAFDCSVCDPTVIIQNNGAGVTEDEIIADGACEGVDPQLPHQPTNLVFSQVAGESVHISFTSSPHPPSFHVILMREMSSPYPEDKPHNGEYWYPGATIGNSLVVAQGGGNVTEFDITGLSPSTEYYFAVYAGNAGVNYVTEPPLQESVTTTGGGTPTNLSFSDVSDNSMTVRFDAAEGYAGYLTIMRSFESGLPSNGPVDGTSYSIGNVINCCTIVVGKGMETTLDIVYLEPELDYYFDVIPYTMEDSSYVYHLDNVLSGHQRTMEQSQPFPNPFVEDLTIPVSIISESANVRIMITDRLGRQISEVVNHPFSTGKHFVRWNRTDQQGQRLAEGVYMYSIITSEADKPVTGLIVAK